MIHHGQNHCAEHLVAISQELLHLHCHRDQGMSRLPNVHVELQPRYEAPAVNSRSFVVIELRLWQCRTGVRQVQLVGFLQQDAELLVLSM